MLSFYHDKVAMSRKFVSKLSILLIIHIILHDICTLCTKTALTRRAVINYNHLRAEIVRLSKVWPQLGPSPNLIAAFSGEILEIAIAFLLAPI